MRRTTILLPLLCLISLGCSKKEQNQTQVSRITPKPPPPAEQIKAGKVVMTASGLNYQDLVIGSGEVARPGNTVSVLYTGWLPDGTEFDSAQDRNHPFVFELGAGQVIRGWDEGVAGMKVGGKRRLIIPPELAYGKSGRGKIPPNSMLTFEVELLAVK